MVHLVRDSICGGEAIAAGFPCNPSAIGWGWSDRHPVGTTLPVTAKAIVVEEFPAGSQLENVDLSACWSFVGFTGISSFRHPDIVLGVEANCGSEIGTVRSENLEVILQTALGFQPPDEAVSIVVI